MLILHKDNTTVGRSKSTRPSHPSDKENRSPTIRRNSKAKKKKIHQQPPSESSESDEDTMAKKTTKRPTKKETELRAQVELLTSMLGTGDKAKEFLASLQKGNLPTGTASGSVAAASGSVATGSAASATKRKSSDDDKKPAAKEIAVDDDDEEMVVDGKLVKCMSKWYQPGGKYKKQPTRPGQKKPPMEKAIVNAIKEHIWPVAKFSPGPQCNQKIATLLIDKVRWGGISDNPKVRAKFINFYDEFCGACLNSRRSYVQTQIKEPAFVWMDKTKGKLPSDELLEKVLSRSIDMQNKDEMDFFVFWWDKIVPQCSGGLAWNEEKRYYMNLSTAAPPNAPDEPYITAGSEAFAALAIKGNREKWEAIWEMMQDKVHENRAFDTRVKDSNGKYASSDGVSTFFFASF